MIRWGVMGTGNILGRVAKCLPLVPGQSFYAIGSKDLSRARQAADKYGAVRAYGSYEELAHDPEVNAVYVATTHPDHLACALTALSAGKPVLCEKPLTMSAGEARQMVACARENHVFLMEAMWTRFIPTIQAVTGWVREGRIGQVRYTTVDFGFRAEIDPQGRLFNRQRGGGALMDLGVYPVSLVSHLMGREPARILSLANIGTTDVDEDTAVLLGYEDGATAALHCSLRLTTRGEAVLYGTRGRIVLPAPFWVPREAVLTSDTGDETFVWKPSEPAEGYEYELREVERCLAQGLLESPWMTWDQSVAVMDTLDRIRREWEK